MNVQLQSDTLEFALTVPDGKWEIHTRGADVPAVHGVSLGAAWYAGTTRRAWAGDMTNAVWSEPEQETASVSPSRALLIELQEKNGVRLCLEISLGLEVHCLCWRIRIENHSNDPIRLGRVDMFRLGRPVSPEGHRATSTGLRLQSGGPDLAFFTNGWESWNPAGALGRWDRFPKTRLGPLALPMSQGAVARPPRRRGEFTSEMFGVVGDRTSRSGLLLGFLSQRQAFGGLRVDLADRQPKIEMWAECDGAVVDPEICFSTDWAFLSFVSLDDQDPLQSYLDQVARANQARNGSIAPVGWCSWYQFNQSLTEGDVYGNLDWVEARRSQIPLEIIQLDDGFASEVGDWYTTGAGFPSGLPAVSRAIRGAGCVPGLWLAPFVAKPGARVLREHPDWILRNRYGFPANAGFIWDTFTRALDVTHPRVIEHVEELISTAVDKWGFDYLKLDFLYAGALRGVRHDPHLTRAQALGSVLERIRSAAGEKRFLVGCGCPLGSGIGIFDSMRIGPDVGTSWKPMYRNIGWPLRHEPGLPSVRNAIHNAITRAPLHGRWWINDPDCLILRGSDRISSAAITDAKEAGSEGPPVSGHNPSSHKPSRITWDETKTLATVVSLTGGAFFVSDHLPDLPEDRIGWLSRLLPPLPSGFRALDWFDERRPQRLVSRMHGATGEWFLIGLINWDDQPSDLSCDLGVLGTATPFAHAVDFWNEIYRPLMGQRLEVKGLAPHGVRLFAIRPRAGPQWLGDTLHISQGLGVSRVTSLRRGIRLDLNLGRLAAGKVWLEIPAPARRATLDGKLIDLTYVEQDVYVCELAFEGSARLEVGW